MKKLYQIQMQIELHPNILALEKKWLEAYKKDGEYISLHEKLYQYNLLYAEVSSRFHNMEATRKILKDKLFLEFRHNGDAKSDKIAEAMARTSSEHQKMIEDIRVQEKYYLQLRGKIKWLENEIEKDKSIQIGKNIERRLSAPAGEGNF